MSTDIYVNSTLEGGGRAAAGATFPGRLLQLVGTYEKTAADTDASVLRLGRVPANAIPVPTMSHIGNDALTGATDVDVGVYQAKDNGAVVDKDCLSDGLDIHSAAVLGSEIRAFQAVGLDEFGQDLRTLAGQSVGAAEQYDVALTGNTFGTATGTISWVLTFLVPQQ